MKKRPFASEGHLRLPPDLAPPAGKQEPLARYAAACAAACAAAKGAPLPRGEVRLLGHAVFDPGGRTRAALVLGDAMAAHGLRAGDRLVLAPREEPEFGDLVVLASEREGEEATLWKAYPEAGVLHLRCGDNQCALTPEDDRAVAGVVVGVRRGLVDHRHGKRAGTGRAAIRCTTGGAAASGAPAGNQACDRRS